MVLSTTCSIGVSRTRLPALPRIFCRQKSLHAAIERGRQDFGASRERRSAPRSDSFQERSSRFGDNSNRFSGNRDRPSEGRSRFDGDRSPAPRSNEFQGRSRFGGNTDRRVPGDSPRETWQARSVRRETEDSRPSARNESFGDRSEKPFTHIHFDKPSKDGESFRERSGSNLERRDSGERRSSAGGESFRGNAGSKSERRTGDRRPAGGRDSFREKSGNGFDRRDSGDRKSSAGREPREFRPETLPYTTAASEFLYGYSSVLAAIKAGRRKLYTLYINDRGLNREGNAAIMAHATDAGIKIRQVGEDWAPLMDKASSGRPHNGYILEASPLPRSPLTKLKASSILKEYFTVELDSQSKEDKLVNGTETHYPYKSGGWRHPFVLYVDGVLDEGNLGAIARSAYFLGVDAIATPIRMSAPWSHIALKASAGAAEAIPIFTVSKPAEFLTQSAREGWRIYGSDAIPDEKHADLTTSSSADVPSSGASSNLVFTHARNPKRLPADHSPVATHPTILMMGAEGEGLRSSLLNQAHYKVGIKSGRETDEIGVDSLNVSVAASLLAFEFLKKQPKAQKPVEYLF